MPFEPEIKALFQEREKRGWTPELVAKWDQEIVKSGYQPKAIYAAFTDLMTDENPKCPTLRKVLSVIAIQENRIKMDSIRSDYKIGEVVYLDFATFWPSISKSRGWQGFIAAKITDLHGDGVMWFVTVPNGRVQAPVYARVAETLSRKDSVKIQRSIGEMEMMDYGCEHSAIETEAKRKETLAWVERKMAEGKSGKEILTIIGKAIGKKMQEQTQ